MTNKEKEILEYVYECITICLRKNVSKNYLAICLDDFIYDFSDDNSSELFNILYRILDNLLLGNEIFNDF